MASFHMDGKALVWFQDADEDGQFPTWEAFTQALLVRFGPVYDDLVGEAMTVVHSDRVYFPVSVIIQPPPGSLG